MRSTNRRRSFSPVRVLRYSWMLLILLFAAACHYDMYEQPRYTPLEPSNFFADGRSARPEVEGAVVAGEVRTDEYFYTGLIDGVEGTEMPFPVTSEDLVRGQEQYNIYCAPCHGATGYGNGMVSARGAVVAANFHNDRFINPESPSSTVGHFYNVITNGYRYMYGYASRIEPADRWRIAAYVRVLQRSQNASVEDVPASLRAELESLPPGERLVPGQ